MFCVCGYVWFGISIIDRKSYLLILKERVQDNSPSFIHFFVNLIISSQFLYILCVIILNMILFTIKIIKSQPGFTQLVYPLQKEDYKMKWFIIMAMLLAVDT